MLHLRRHTSIMKFWLLLLPALIASMLCPRPCFGQKWEERAFPIQSLDLGDVAKGSTVEFSFPVVNSFDSELIIDSIDSNCGCTAVHTGQMTIAPGETSEIQGKINTEAYSGRRKAILTVRLRSPAAQEIRLRVDSFIRTDLVLYPGAIHFSDAFTGKAYTKKTTLMHAGSTPIGIKSIELPRAWIRCTHRESFREDDKTNFELEVTIADDAPAGDFREIINLTLDDGKNTVLPLMVSGIIARELSISPRSIFLSSIATTDPIKINLVVIGREPIKIDSITSEDWTIEYDATKSQKRTHLLPIKISPNQKPTGKLSSALRIQATGSKTWIIETPITAVFQPAE